MYRHDQRHHASRYPAVLTMEMDVFRQYVSDVTVQEALSRKMREIADGKCPRSYIVLDALFRQLLRASPKV